jgi:hypothetical protein
MAALSSSRAPRKPSAALARATAPVCESLEGRQLLSTINWINKGTGAGAGDTDGFNAQFGSDATVARSIVQRAIDDWEAVIVDFNGAGGRNSFDLTISTGSLASNVLASTNVTTVDAALKPSAATITIDPNNTTWYFDAVIGSASVPDDSEFVTLVTPFAADANALSGRDFYRSTLHEIGHAMGLAGNVTLFTGGETDVGDDPNSTDPADRLTTIDVNGDGLADYTFTSTGGRHLFEGGGNYTGPIHPNELLNPGRSVSTTVLRRTLISDTVAQFYDDVFDYTIKLPSTINTFYVNLDTSGNSVTVRGDVNPNGNVNDNIDLEVSGTAMRFEVNGTTETIEGAQFGTIIVNAGDGNDDIDVDELLAGKVVTVNGEEGNDRIDIAQQLGDVDGNLESNVTANGGVGTDTIAVHDSNDVLGADDYTITSPAVQTGSTTISHLLFERVELFGSSHASTYHIDSFAPFSKLVINAGAAGDGFVVGDDDYDSRIYSDIEINAGGGTDELIIEDEADTGTGIYTLTSGSFGKTGGGAISFSSIALATINASDQGSLFNVDLFNSSMAAVINAGAGNDTLDVDGATDDIDNSLVAALEFRGQGGSDRIDLNDSGDNAQAEDYVLSGDQFTKSSTAGVLTFAGVESIDLLGNGGANTITVEFGNLPANMNVTVNGGGGADEITSLVPGTFSLLEGNVTLQGGAGIDTIHLNDGAGSFADRYTLTSDTLQAAEPGRVSGLITYVAENVEIVASAVASTIRIDSTAAGTDYSIRAGDGDDTFTFGGAARNVSNILGPVSVSGEAGNDRINYNDDNHTTDSSYMVSTGSLFRSGTGQVDPAGIEEMLVNAGDGADTITVAETFAAATTTVNGNGGNDIMIVAAGVWDGAIEGPVTANGGQGSDTLVIDDSNDVGLDNYDVSSTRTTKTIGGGAIDYNGMEVYQLDANLDANNITVNSTFDGDFRINGNGGDDRIDVVDNFAGRYVRVDGNAGLDVVRVNTDAIGSANVEFDATQDLSLLRVFAGGAARVNDGAEKVLYTQGLVIDSGASLDLTDQDLVLDYTGPSPLATVRTLLTDGHAGGAWNGAGINSSTAANDATHKTALGYGEAGSVLGSAGGSFAGIGVDSTAILVKYTWYGDANLSGSVDVEDLGRLASNWQQSSRNWVQGNFDYDPARMVDVNDLGQLATNWQEGTSGPLAPKAEKSPSMAAISRSVLS